MRRISTPPRSQAPSEFAEDHTERFAVDGIGLAQTAQLVRWRAGDADRTTYLLDVRTPEEFATEHLPGSISTPGGQLILGTHRYIGVRGARLVLISDTGTRATTAAHWLRRRRWEVWTHLTTQTLATTAPYLERIPV